MDTAEKGPTDEVGTARPRFHIPIYDDVLKVAEVYAVMALLFGVIGGTFVNILNRNFDLQIWDYRIVSQVIYSMVFLLGMYGGVIAARRAQHIAIDAVGHLLPERWRLHLARDLQIVGGITCFILSRACYTWIMAEEAGKSLVEGEDGIWWLDFRLWRYPVVVAFGLMSLHFFVNAGRQSYELVHPTPPSTVETGPRPDAEDASE